MKHTTVAIALAAALALPQAVLVQAAETPAATPQAQTQAVKGYLGVSIDRLPDALRAQLANAIPTQQGVLVTQVVPGSPAEKAGIEPFDILLRYNDQELFSPEQLTKLVGSDTGGKPVKLTIVRAG
ncbi:MAG: PDZ domain-containing protein, partial [Thiogranum sp.]